MTSSKNNIWLSRAGTFFNPAAENTPRLQQKGSASIFGDKRTLTGEEIGKINRAAVEKYYKRFL